MKKKIGILGGSFDPVHFGHLNLAICLMESCALDEVLFIPTRLSPFKEHIPPIASAEHRLAMLKKALAPLPQFKIIDWEIHGQGPAYTIDTVRKLITPSVQLHLLLGEDHLSSLDRWKEGEELIRLAPPLIGSRKTSDTPIAAPFPRIKIPLLEISSTTIRERLAHKKYCGHLVPAIVLDYIHQNHLYQAL